jgi:hypothetical protein
VRRISVRDHHFHGFLLRGIDTYSSNLSRHRASRDEQAKTQG